MFARLHAMMDALLQSLSKVFDRLGISQDLIPLLWRGGHSPAVRHQRHVLIVSRAQLIARLLAILTLLWIPIDALTMAWPLWSVIAFARIVTAAAFQVLGTYQFQTDGTSGPRRALIALIAIPLVFHLGSIVAFSHFGQGMLTTAAATTYVYIPFIVAAGLAIFALTAEESAVLAAGIILTMGISIAAWPELLGQASAAATLWRLLLIAGIAGLAGISQLRILVSLIEQSTRDALTGALTRKTGEEMIEQQFSMATRTGAPLSVAFLDLDHFKAVNDRFGHHAGDAQLAAAAHALRATLRLQDMVVRWGGEEFLLILPATDEQQAIRAVQRIAEAGLGLRPDGSAQTASVGIAERNGDKAARWVDLVRLADERMYAAKRAGRDALVGSAGAAMSLAANAPAVQPPAVPPIALAA